jgi:hypothetical protein
MVIKQKGFFMDENLNFVKEKLSRIETRNNSWNVKDSMRIETEFGIVGEIHKLTFGVVREQAPIYTMGNPHPVHFTTTRKYVEAVGLIDRETLASIMNNEYTAFIFEERIDDEVIQIKLENAIAIETEDDGTLVSARFTIQSVSVTRVSSNNKAFANKLLKKEWKPCLPLEALMVQI